MGRLLGGSRLARAVCALGLALAPIGAVPARAEEAPPPPKVGLDKLLKLPSTLDVDVDKRGGATRSEWRARYRESRAELETAQAGLKKAQAKLDKAAAESDSPWRMAAPGAATNAESTERYPLTLEVKRQRAEVERAEKRLRELDVEANLAAVPKAWRE